LLRIKENPFENTILDYFDFLAWVEAKAKSIEKNRKKMYSK
jgi:hypothetical protein